jgi:hypothetical protein
VRLQPDNRDLQRRLSWLSLGRFHETMLDEAQDQDRHRPRMRMAGAGTKAGLVVIHGPKE